MMDENERPEPTNDISERLEREIRPLISTTYDCCGCSTYGKILDHAIRIVNEDLPALLEEWEIAGRYGGDTS